MRRIVRAIYHTNGTYYHIGPAAVAICEYSLYPFVNITRDFGLLASSFHTNAFSKVSVFIAAQTKKNIVIDISVFVSISSIHTKTLENDETTRTAWGPLLESSGKLPGPKSVFGDKCFSTEVIFLALNDKF